MALLTETLSSCMGLLAMGTYLYLFPWWQSIIRHSSWLLVDTVSVGRMVLLMPGLGAVPKNELMVTTCSGGLGEHWDLELSSLEKATVMAVGGNWKSMGSVAILSECYSNPDSFQMFQQSSFARDWQVEVTVTSSLCHLAEELTMGQGLRVSNGSFITVKGSWLLEGSMSNQRIAGACLVPGIADNHSSFCSKLTGIFVALLTLQSQKLPLELTPILFACDGRSVLDHLTNLHVINPQEWHADLLMVVRGLLKLLPVQVHFFHVGGHQDALGSWLSLCNHERGMPQY